MLAPQACSDPRTTAASPKRPAEAPITRMPLRAWRRTPAPAVPRSDPTPPCNASAAAATCDIAKTKASVAAAIATTNASVAASTADLATSNASVAAATCDLANTNASVAAATAELATTTASVAAATAEITSAAASTAATIAADPFDAAAIDSSVDAAEAAITALLGRSLTAEDFSLFQFDYNKMIAVAYTEDMDEIPAKEYVQGANGCIVAKFWCGKEYQTEIPNGQLYDGASRHGAIEKVAVLDPPAAKKRGSRERRPKKPREEKSKRRKPRMSTHPWRR